jgi:hypothetical protein
MLCKVSAGKAFYLMLVNLNVLKSNFLVLNEASVYILLLIIFKVRSFIIKFRPNIYTFQILLL